MKRYLILIIMFIQSNNVFSQCEIDTILNKYSYQMVGFKDGGDSTIFPLGTCFFVRQNNKTYLVTAAHTITGINTFDLSKTPAQYDYIGFRYFDTRTDKISFSRLDAREVKKSLMADYFYNIQDCVIIEMKDTLVEPFIFSMENFVGKLPDGYSYSKALAIGYPYIDSTQYNKDMKPYYLWLSPVKNISPHHKYPQNDETYFVMTPKSIQGLSGSPVIYIYQSSVNKDCICLLKGVLFGANNDLNYSYITPIGE